MTNYQADVIVVGAGFAGMYLLHRLRSMGFNTLVLEAGAGVGGTWYWNRYPGARCDVESIQYSYQFDEELQQHWEWSERYSSQREILEYAEHVADRFDLHRDIRFNTRVETAKYDEQNRCWVLSSADNAAFNARFCIMATGCLSMPNWPQITGLTDFNGPVYHTAIWPHTSLDFTGQRVGLIGTGSSAIQSIPLIARQASKLTVFQRTANYSIPAHNRPSDPGEVAAAKKNYAALRSSAKANFSGIAGEYNQRSALSVSASTRESEFESRWQRGGLTFMGAYGDLLKDKEANDSVAEFARKKIRQTVKDPVLADKLCPTNTMGAKRLCVDTGYYETFNLEHVELVDLKQNAIESISAGCIHTAQQRYEVDVIVIATGFDAMTGALARIDIQGAGQVSLETEWRQGPSSYLGLAMADFPNLFTVTGPGSPSVLTNMLPTIEQHVEWISGCLAYTRDEGYHVVEAIAEYQEDWWSHCQEVANIGLKSSTESWYTGANVAGKARVFMPYFGGFPAYIEKCEEVVQRDYEGFRFA